MTISWAHLRTQREDSVARYPCTDSVGLHGWSEVKIGLALPRKEGAKNSYRC